MAPDPVLPSSGILPAAGLRVGFFGAFHPMTDRAGAASTGMVLLMARSPKVAKVVVFGPPGAEAPQGLTPPNVEVLTAWAPDDPGSLAAALRRMTRRAPELDGFVFSIYPTFFGRSPLSNGLGLLLPVMVRRLTGLPVAVFMHNSVESQDIRALGYDVPATTIMAARWLERRVGRTTRVAAGLESQARSIREGLGVPVSYVPMRYVESVPGLLAAAAGPDGAPARPAAGGGGPLRVLFFGTWGPQKDLAGALEALRPMLGGPVPIRVTIAGTANPNFPEYADGLDRLAKDLPTESFRFLGYVGEAQVPGLFASHDVLVLPYRVAGGYSGVMNVGAAYDIRILAYDQPQLRECAALLDAPVEFISESDPAALRDALARPPPVGAAPRRAPSERLAEGQRGIEQLLGLLAAPS